MDLQEVGVDFEDWMELAQDRDRWRALVSTVSGSGSGSVAHSATLPLTVYLPTPTTGYHML